MSNGQPASTLRAIAIAKVIILSILTFGIYFLVSVYKNTKDIQNARAQPFGAWRLVFWLGVFLPIIGLVNYVMNGVGLAELRSQRNADTSTLWIVALVLSIVLPPIGQIIWAVHYNASLTAASQGANAGTGATA